MEINVFDCNLTFLGVIDDFFSLRWRRKYTTAGEFELHCNANKHSLSLLKEGNILSKDGCVEAGVIDAFEITRDEHTGENIKVTGGFLSSYLERRITGDLIVLYETAQDAMRYYVNEHCINPKDTKRKIPLLFLGNKTTDTEKMYVQATYKNLLVICEKIAKRSGLGFRIKPDFKNKNLAFEVYRGVDKTAKQTIVPRVVLSEEYDNVKNTIYCYDESREKTYCQIIGKDENDNIVKVFVGGGTGLARKELNINSSAGKSKGTEEESIALWKQEGVDGLEKNKKIENFEAEIDYLGDYKKEWDLGDIVTCEKTSWGKTLDARVAEVEEIYEKGIMKVIPVLGSPAPEKIDLTKDE